MIPEWMVPGVIFMWADPEAYQCHYKILDVSEDRTTMNVIVVKADKENMRPLGRQGVRNTEDCEQLNPVKINNVDNYKRSHMSFNFKRV